MFINNSFWFLLLHKRTVKNKLYCSKAVILQWKWKHAASLITINIIFCFTLFIFVIVFYLRVASCVLMFLCPLPNLFRKSESLILWGLSFFAVRTYDIEWSRKLPSLSVTFTYSFSRLLYEAVHNINTYSCL